MDITTRDGRDLVEAADGVQLAQLVAGDEMSVQYFRIEPGTGVPTHDHPHEQTGYVTQGQVTFVLADGAALRVNGEPVDGSEVTVGPGDGYVIPGGEPHAAENRGDGVVEGVDVFSPPRTNVPWE